MDALEALLTRTSAKSLGPTSVQAAHLRTALEAAVRAPDHGRLRPWRFIVVEGDQRLALGEIFARALQRRGGEYSAGDIERERAKALRSPLIVIVGCHVVSGTKIPEIEQVLAAGAAAENLMLALHAQGYGAVWKTGAPAYDPYVKRAVGLAPEDHIVGFIYAGGDATYSPGKPASVDTALLPFAGLTD
jgi:nitroreductase